MVDLTDLGSRNLPLDSIRLRSEAITSLLSLIKTLGTGNLLRRDSIIFKVDLPEIANLANDPHPCDLA